MENRIGFQKGADKEGKRYSRFFKKNSVSIQDIHDAEEIADKMKKLLGDFQKCFEAIAEVLPGFTHEVTKLAADSGRDPAAPVT